MEHPQPPRTISVTGEGKTSAAPDRADIALGVVTDGKTASEALRANSERMTTIIGNLKKAGIPEKDIQTSNFSINPTYEPYRDGNPRPPKIVGYQVSNQVSVVFRDMTKLGQMLDAVVEVGANSIGGLSFSLDAPRPALDEARKKAVADAKARAELLTEAAGVKIVRVLNISESSYAQPYPKAMMMARAAESFADAAPIEGGEVEYQAQVSITYEIE